MVGNCLIRLKNVRPTFLPVLARGLLRECRPPLGRRMGRGRAIREGSTCLATTPTPAQREWPAGGSFPASHHHARFTVDEAADRFRVALRSDDGVTAMSVNGRRTDRLPESSVFHSLGEASQFFLSGSLGYSATPDPSRFQGWRSGA